MKFSNILNVFAIFSKLCNFDYKPTKLPLFIYLFSRSIYPINPEYKSFKFIISENPEFEIEIKTFKKSILLYFLNSGKVTIEKKKLKLLSCKEMINEIWNVMGVNYEAAKNLGEALKELQNTEKSAKNRGIFNFESLRMPLKNALDAAANEILVKEHESSILLLNIISDFEIILNKNIYEKIETVDKTLSEMNDRFINHIDDTVLTNQIKINSFFVVLKKALKQLLLIVSIDTQNVQSVIKRKRIADTQLYCFKQIILLEYEKIIPKNESIPHKIVKNVIEFTRSVVKSDSLEIFLPKNEDLVFQLVNDVQGILKLVLNLEIFQKHEQKAKEIFLEMNETRVARISANESLKIETKKVMELLETQINDFSNNYQNREEVDKATMDEARESIILTEALLLPDIINETLKTADSAIAKFKIEISEVIKAKMSSEKGDKMFSFVTLEGLKVVSKQNLETSATLSLEDEYDANCEKAILFISEERDKIVENFVKKNVNLDTVKAIENIIRNTMLKTVKFTMEQVISKFKSSSTLKRISEERKLLRKSKDIMTKLSLLLSSIEKKSDEKSNQGNK